MEQQINNNSDTVKTKSSSYQFWFFALLSIFLIVTFVYYLPLRFRTSGDDRGHNDAAMMDDHAHEDDLPSVETLSKLSLRTPKDATEKLSFTLAQDGVKEFTLVASEFRWEMADGTWTHVWGYNGQIPGPEIRVNEGDKVRVIVRNNLPDSTSVHWHGIDVPWQADGVPGVTQQAIKPGEEFVYEFTADPAGTHFYHTHGKDHETAAQQLDMGLSGAFIIAPSSPSYSHDRDFTLVLDEWNVMPNGQNMSAMHGHGAFSDEMMHDQYNAFTINGRVFPDTTPIDIEQGETILIRFINAGTSAFHPMHLHGHNFKVVAMDGNPIPAASVETRNTITVHPGETADILVEANNPGPWLLHCHHVHHAAAGMTTLFQYEGYAPIE